MLEKKERYDPRVYGDLRAAFLNKLDSVSPTTFDSDVQKQERQRRELIEDIREGRIIIPRR